MASKKGISSLSIHNTEEHTTMEDIYKIKPNNIEQNPLKIPPISTSPPQIPLNSPSPDPLDSFLPPPPTTNCSEALQEKINKFIAIKKCWKSFNEELRKRKDYRNPDFLVHAVRYQDIDEIGSCFGKDVFDPHGYDKCDFYDEIERKEQERSIKRNNKKSRWDNNGGALSAAAAQAVIMSAAIAQQRRRESEHRR